MPGLTFIGDGNPNSSSTTASPPAHASTAIGDFVIIPCVWKPSTGTLTTPSGWTAGTIYTLGTGTSGIDTGPVRISAFWRVIASTTLPGIAIDPTGSNSIINAGSVTWRPDTGWIVEVTSTSGQDTSADTNFSCTGAAVLPYVKNDWVMVTAGIPDDTPTWTAEGQMLGGASGATFNTFDSKWSSHPTTGPDLGTETVTALCLSGPATTVPSLAVTTSQATGSTGGMVFYRLHPVHLPWHLLGIDGTNAGNHFKLQAAPDGGGAIFEKTRAEIVAGYYQSPYLYAVGDDQEWCRFQVRLDSQTTGGTQYPRSELREMQTNGTSDASWSTASSTHRLKVRLKWPMLSHLTKPTIVGGQIHDGDNDLLQITTELNATSGLVEGKLRINGTSSGRPKLELDVREDDPHDYLVEVASGVTRVWWDDWANAIHRTTDVSGTTCYFKTGCYPNTNETTDDATDYAMVDISSVTVWHTGYTGDQALPPTAFEQPSSLLFAA